VTNEPAQQAASPHEESAADTALTRKTPWTLRQNITRTIWMTFGRLAWALIPRMRSRLIRLFGGKVGKNCVFASSVEVTIPWHVDIGDNVRVRPGAIIYSLGKIKIGENSVLDSRAHLCAGTHDMADPAFPLVRRPITIGKNCLVGIDSYVAPGVVIGDDCRIWPRASVYKSQPDGVSLRGNPARPIDPAEAEHEELEAVNHEIEQQRHARLQQSEHAS
jgi:putative colanic acid biosynthesis acetyltransferase WcaF